MNNNSCARVRSPRHIWDVSGCDSSSEALARSISINTPAVMAIRSTSGHIKLDICHIIKPAPTAVENVSAILPPRRPNEASRSSTRFTDQKAIAATPIPAIIIALATRKAKKPPTAFAVCGQVIHRITGETIPAVIPNDKTATPAGDFMSCAPGMVIAERSCLSTLARAVRRVLMAAFVSASRLSARWRMWSPAFSFARRTTGNSSVRIESSMTLSVSPFRRSRNSSMSASRAGMRHWSLRPVEGLSDSETIVPVTSSGTVQALHENVKSTRHPGMWHWATALKFSVECPILGDSTL